MDMHIINLMLKYFKEVNLGNKLCSLFIFVDFIVLFSYHCHTLFFFPITSFLSPLSTKTFFLAWIDLWRICLFPVSLFLGEKLRVWKGNVNFSVQLDRSIIFQIYKKWFIGFLRISELAYLFSRNSPSGHLFFSGISLNTNKIDVSIQWHFNLLKQKVQHTSIIIVISTY